MSRYKKKVHFFDTEEARLTEETLRVMVSDKAYLTEPSYNANGALYPDHMISFVDKHMNYLRTHPGVKPDQYLSNLRLITRITQ
jgi:hypothetical protein